MSVCGGVPEARRKWRQIGSRKVRVARKLDESKAAWIVRQKAGGAMTNRQIAEAMGVKTRRVQALWARYRHLRLADVQFPMPMCRPSGGLPGRREHGAVAGLHSRRRAGAARMEGYIERSTGIHIAHGTIHYILDADGEAEKAPEGIRRRAWVRWEW